MVAQTETGWGWLYDVPWTAGNYHDFMTLERIRASVSASRPLPTCSGPGRGGCAWASPGCQASSATPTPSRCRWPTSFPATSARTPSTRTGSAAATVRNIRCRDAGRDAPILIASAEIALHPASEVTLGTFELRAGQVIELELRLDALDQAGVVLTHGNHPDSLQLGVEAGRLWFGISGEKEYAATDVVAGRWYEVAIALDSDRVAMSAGRRRGRRYQPLVGLAAVEGAG